MAQEVKEHKLEFEQLRNEVTEKKKDSEITEHISSTKTN